MPRKPLTVSIPMLDVNGTDDAGRTALLLAVQQGRTGVVWHLLCEQAADPTGHFPLHAHAEARLAFAMAMHPRVGQDSVASQLPPEILALVLAACIDPSDLLSAVAARAGHADTAELLQWLEAGENAASAHAAAHEAASSQTCPRCAGRTYPREVALVPCGHRVCAGCWSQLGDAHAGCPQCTRRVLIAVTPESFARGERLRSCFDVQL